MHGLGEAGWVRRAAGNVETQCACHGHRAAA
jgi:hypothetical protein